MADDDPGLRAPLYAVTSNDHAAWVVATSLIFVVYSVAAVTAKMLTRLNMASIRPHDLVIVVATVLVLTETICIIYACKHGLGKHVNAIPARSLLLYHKFIYAAQILYLIALASTKVSICLLIGAISPQPRLILANRILLAVITAWTVAGTFLLAFQCSLPSPWNTGPGMCLNRRGIFYFNGIMNILTDVALVFLPAFMMWRIKTTSAKRWKVIALFANRIFVPVVTIPYLVSLTQYFDNENRDATWVAVMPTIWSQIVLSVAVFTACLPSLKSFVDGLLGGTASITIQAPYHLTRSGEESRLHAVSWDSPEAPRRTSGASKKNSFSARLGSENRPGVQYYNSVTTSKSSEKRNSKTQRSGSAGSMREGVIVRTVGYDIRYEGDDGDPDAITEVEKRGPPSSMKDDYHDHLR